MTQLRKEEENLQADIATTAEHLAERDGAALLQEKYHQKLETLENLLESWEQGRKELEEKQSAYQCEIKREMLYGKHIRRWNLYFWMHRREFWQKN